MALTENLQILSADLGIKQAKALQGTAFNPEKTGVEFAQDPIMPGLIDRKIGITQTFEFPTVYTSQSKMLKQETILAEKSKNITQNEIVREVSETYYDMLHALQTVNLLQQQDSIYADFLHKATARYNTGESSQLEKMNAESKYQENRLQLNQAISNLANRQLEMQKLLNTGESILPQERDLQKIPDIVSLDIESVTTNPLLGHYDQQLNVNIAQVNVEKNKLLPDIFGGYYFTDSKTPSFQVGISVPLFFGAQRSKIKAANIRSMQISTEKQQAMQSLQNIYALQYNEYLKAKESLTYYETTGVTQANDMVRVANASYQIGEIGYMEYIQNMQTAINIKLQYADAMNRFNQTIILLNYLKGNK
jgi:cobalt-zinc-cadmium resistance protein CzcA